MEIKIAITDNDILKCWDVIRELRPHLEQESFVPLIKEMIREGYVLAYTEQDNKAVAAIGFRYLQFLFMGKHIYIDDLSTLPSQRGKGLGSRLLDYVEEKAKAEGYEAITLDSGYQRNAAHKLYLNKGFVLGSHHFVKRF
jgi:GNAT superfamily N-acetyltransferase